MLRLESHDFENVDAAQQDLEALAVDLREAGYEDVEVGEFAAPKWARMRESAESEFVHVLNVVLDDVQQEAVGALLVVVFNWARKRIAHRGRHDAKPTVIVWVVRDDGDADDVREAPLPPVDDLALEIARIMDTPHWPRWPWLPVKRGDEDNRVLGFVYADDVAAASADAPIRVYETTGAAMGKLIGGELIAADELEVIDYFNSVEALLAAGWIVD